MKPLTLKPDEIKSLQSGRVVIWREEKTHVNLIRWNTIVLSGYGGWTDDHGRPIKCPYQPGAELWVRETFNLDDTDPSFVYYKESGKQCGEWKQPQHMPRWASRYTVRVVSVSPEQRETWGWRVELEVV